MATMRALVLICGVIILAVDRQAKRCDGSVMRLGLLRQSNFILERRRRWKLEMVVVYVQLSSLAVGCEGCGVGRWAANRSCLAVVHFGVAVVGKCGHGGRRSM